MNGAQGSDGNQVLMALIPDLMVITQKNVLVYRKYTLGSGVILRSNSSMQLAIYSSSSDSLLVIFPGIFQNKNVLKSTTSFSLLTVI